MKVLVAGGAGYVGSVLVPLLREHSYDVSVVDKLMFGNYLPPEVPLLSADLFDLTESDLAPFEQVIFLAGLSNDPMADLSPGLNFIENGALPSYLAYVARKAGVRRFIYASSCSVYGYSVGKLYDEECPVTCGYPYGISKLQGERGVLQLADDGFSTIALRQGTVCGYSPRMRFDLIVNSMYRTAMLHGQIVVNNPSIWRPIIDVRDTAMAFLRAVQADYNVNGVFNVAYDNFTVGHVGDTVRDELERLTGKSVGITVNRMEDFRNYKVTCEKARLYLGFYPRFGIADIIKSIFEHAGEYGGFSDERFYNIQVFQKLIEKHGVRLNR